MHSIDVGMVKVVTKVAYTSSSRPRVCLGECVHSIDDCGFFSLQASGIDCDRFSRQASGMECDLPEAYSQAPSALRLKEQRG